MIRTIVFDFGNVIGFFDHRRASAKLAPHAGISIDQMHAILFDPVLEDAYESGRITSAEFVRQLHRSCRFACSEEELAAHYVDIFWPNPEVCAWIPRLKPRYRLLLGSNTTELHFRHFRREFDEQLRHFDHLVVSFEVGARKPRASFFEHCQQLADCKPHECLFIDDLPANVAGAKALGWHGIVYRPGQLEQNLAPFLDAP